MLPPSTSAAEAKEALPPPSAHDGENGHHEGPARDGPVAPPPPALVEPGSTTASQAMRLLGGLSPQELRRSIVMLQEHLQARERFEHTSSRLVEAALSAETPRSLTPDLATPPPAFDNDGHRGKGAIRAHGLDPRQLARSRSKKSAGGRNGGGVMTDVEKTSADAQRDPVGANDVRGPPAGGPADPTAAQREAEEQAERNFKPKTLKFWTIIISIFMAMFLVALDRTIIGTAIPAITNEFRSVGDIGWYGSAYQLTTAASQLVFGRVYKFYNIKWYVRISLLLRLCFGFWSGLETAAGELGAARLVGAPRKTSLNLPEGCLHGRAHKRMFPSPTVACWKRSGRDRHATHAFGRETRTSQPQGKGRRMDCRRCRRGWLLVAPNFLSSRGSRNLRPVRDPEESRDKP